MTNDKLQRKPSPFVIFHLQFVIFIEMVRKQLIVMTRYPVDFVTSFVQIFFMILLFTLASIMFEPRGATEMTSMSSNTGAVMMYGFVLFMFVSDTLWTIGYNIREEQYQGTLESLYLTPASKFASLVSRVTTIVVWTGLLSIAAVVFVQLFLGRLPFHNVGLGAALLLFTLSGTFGLGFAFAAYTLLVKESAQTAANFLQFALMILCGMFFPFHALPEVLQWISRVVPLSYAVDAFRSTLMGYPQSYPELAPIEVEIAIVVAFGILGPLVGYWLYRQAERRARIVGSLAEF
ncbi:MAG: ABC transporter permease [Chloroflexota bacterium]|nr:ABC transporter permease [Chloroflexota bacterium]